MMIRYTTISWVALVQVTWLLTIVLAEPDEVLQDHNEVATYENADFDDESLSQDDILALVEDSTAQNYGGDCTENYRVESLKLALTWAPGACATEVNCKNFKADFTIHGLWPVLNKLSSASVCCTKEKFNSINLNPITKGLQTHWGALSHMSDEKFWFYEWNKHGRCAHKIKNLSTVFQYFNFALQSYRTLRVKELLVANGFPPKNQGTYQGRKIARLLEDNYGFRVQLICKTMRNYPNKILLTEIRICLTVDLKMTDCYTSNSACLGEIMLLAA